MSPPWESGAALGTFGPENNLLHIRVSKQFGGPGIYLSLLKKKGGWTQELSMPYDQWCKMFDDDDQLRNIYDQWTGSAEADRGYVSEIN